MKFLIRIKGLLFNTKNEWNLIREEETTYPRIVKTFLIYILAFRIIISTVKMILNGPYKGMSEISSFLFIILIYGLWLLYIYISALIINFIAPWFGAERNKSNAIKVASYCSVSIFISTILESFPIKYLWIFSLGYLIYLKYQGLTILMGSTKNSFLYALFPEILLLILSLIIALAGYILVSIFSVGIIPSM